MAEAAADAACPAQIPGQERHPRGRRQRSQEPSLSPHFRNHVPTPRAQLPCSMQRSLLGISELPTAWASLSSHSGQSPRTAPLESGAQDQNPPGNLAEQPTPSTPSPTHVEMLPVGTDLRRWPGCRSEEAGDPLAEWRTSHLTTGQASTKLPAVRVRPTPPRALTAPWLLIQTHREVWVLPVSPGTPAPETSVAHSPASNSCCTGWRTGVSCKCGLLPSIPTPLGLQVPFWDSNL